MARVPVRRLRLRPGEEHRETLSLAVPPLRFGGEGYIVVPSPVAAELVVQRATTGDLFGLRFTARLEGPCMRCLAPAGIVIELEAREYEARDPSGDEELQCEYLVDGELDVETWARDQLSLAVPDQILCRPDCAGLCPICGKDLNLEPHEHEGSAIDPRWAALESLRDDRPHAGTVSRRSGARP